MSSTPPPLVSLYAFALVAETGSLAAAAARLNVTQPAISKRIRGLEDQLGVALIARGANAVRLTETGRDYAASLGAAFRAIDAATGGLDARAARPLRVRAYTTWGMRWLIPRLPHFRDRHPGQEVELTTSVEPVDFARDKVDVAIRAAETQPTPTAVRLQTAMAAAFGAPGPARIARRQGFGGLTLLGSRARPDDWSIWSAATGTPLTTMPLMFESTSLAIQAAIEGLGVVIVSPIYVADEVRRRRLVQIVPGAVPTGHDFWLLLPPGPVRPASGAFRDWLFEEIAADAARGG
ncbi:MAG: LysR family transcriptional regulator [Phreatobacter sp.]